MKMLDKAHKKLSLRNQCALLGLSRATVYYQPIVPEDSTWLANEIHDLWIDLPEYGYRRITAALRRANHDINHKKVLRIMREMGIQAIYPKPKTTIRNNEHKTFPYLLKDLVIDRPNQVWATDITYIKLPTGFVYLVAIIDVYSRFIVAWRLSNSLDTEFCKDMAEGAFATALPEIFNSDQGCQYTSAIWIELLQVHGVKISMDGAGRWADNIFIERFWRTLKHAHVLLHAFETVNDAKASIGAFIQKYNTKRLHQSLGYKTPAEAYFKKDPIASNVVPKTTNQSYVPPTSMPPEPLNAMA